MSSPIAIALCGLPDQAARRISAWLAQHLSMGLQVALTADSPDRLLEQLAAQPVHGVVLDGSLGLEGLSFAQELLTAGYTAVCLAGTGDRPQIRQRAGELGLSCCPDYEPERLVTTLRRLLGLIHGAAATDGQVITFHSPRGGAGTSTLLMHLAFALQGRGGNVVVVETGGAGNAVPLLGLRPERGWSEIPLTADLSGDADAPGLISRALIEVQPGLYLLPSGGPAIMDQVEPGHLEATLRLLPACGFTHLLVDTASELTLLTATALTAADMLCLVTLPDPISAFRLMQMQEILAGLRLDPGRIQPVINRSRESLPQRMTEVLDFLGCRPPLRISEEARPPHDSTGRFVGFRPGSGAAKALQTLLEHLTTEVTIP